MNPAAMFKIMQAKNTFTKNHPKFEAFLRNVMADKIVEGTVIEVSIQRPGEEAITTNIRVQQSDIDLTGIPNAQPEVKEVLEYLSQIEGKGILTGQHTQTMEQPEIWRIRKITGKLPAICGFELLSYSPNIRRETADEECLKEVDENTGTLEKAWEWAERGGLMTFTWHWFSPMGGSDKSFYAEKTDYNAAKAVIEGTPEHEALCHDLDHMAGILQPFCDRHIPILWRPFHESEGEWFWWGAKGPVVAAELFRFMFRYYTQHHHLDNLIWVWNSPLPEGYAS